jgi:ketose-bisphosphate aldolase
MIALPLSSSTSLLRRAWENKYGVAAINTFNFETVKWAVKAAEQEKMPLIVQFYPGYDFFIPPAFIAHMAVTLAKEAAVPVAVHLDHSTAYDIAVKGLKAGFPSIMVDGSRLPYEENIALTAAVSRAAKVFGVDLEAELGHVGSGAKLDDITNAGHFTDPVQAVDFVEKTGCDFLAVAVGNAHGPYIQTPKLDFDRIKALRKALSIPMVLHGCSDIPDDQMQECVNQGISKFNIATEYFRAFQNGMAAQKSDDAFSVITKAEEAAVEFVRRKIRLLNPNGKSI